MDRLVVATHNLKKAGEMVAILTRLLPKVEILPLAEFPGAPEPQETGENYADNAAIKSESAALYTGVIALADDAGLEIDALDGAPGLHSKRFGGEDLPFDQKMSRILGLLKDVPEPSRTARFRCCIALSVPGKTKEFQRLSPGQFEKEDSIEESKTIVFESTCEGLIAFSPKGSGGFGYDPIFFLPELGRHMAELSPEEKHAVSHRGKVLREFAKFLERKNLTSSQTAGS